MERVVEPDVAGPVRHQAARTPAVARETSHDGPDPSDRLSPNRAGLVRLQRSAGNRAVGQMLQRHALPTVEPDAPPAPPGLAQAAPNVPGAPGAATTTDASGGGPGSTAAPPDQTVGGVDAGTTAPPQSTGAPATTDAANATGPAALDSQVAADRFAKEMVGEEREWATQATPDARAAALTQMLGRRLTDSGTPPPSYTLRSDLAPGTLGNFGFATWTLNINQTLVSAPSITPDQADQIANTFYHEGRHCDQWFRMARLEAGKAAGEAAGESWVDLIDDDLRELLPTFLGGFPTGGKAAETAATIATKMGIQNTIAAQACANPIMADSPEAAEVQVWWDSVYGAHHDDRNTTLNNLDQQSRANAAAQAAYEADHTPANLAAWQAANATLQTTFAAYQALPEEVSARAAASRINAALQSARALDAAERASHGPGDFEVPTGDTAVA